MTVRIVGILSLLCCLLAGCAQPDKEDFVTKFELSDSLETPTYEEAMAWWSKLDESFREVKMVDAGQTDAGFPLHVVVLSPSLNFSPETLREREKTIVLINNAIHPGEPDGVDASMLLFRELLFNREKLTAMEDVVLLCIPFYNVDGARNRNCCSRANQNGPMEYGFRGNASNLDLNRDFIKADSRNAESFIRLFHTWQPDMYVETHVTNGADYAYTMTYLSALPSKTEPPMQTFLEGELVPWLKTRMKDAGDEMVPYVNIHGEAPDKGFAAFYDSPRYSTGFASLFQTIGFITETHMLKPFPDRVLSTLRFLGLYVQYAAENGETIKEVRQHSKVAMQNQNVFALRHELDSSAVKPLPFHGYEALYDTSEVTGLERMRYDRGRPWHREVPYYHSYKPTVSVEVPAAYVIKPGWHEVMDRLQWNNVQMETIEKDSVIEVEVYYVDNYETVKQPYEGHYLHYNTQCRKERKTVRVPAHSILVRTAQPAKRFIVETLEPEATDSYFNWNFFDEILQQKEWYSAYVFEDDAKHMLETDTALQQAFENYRGGDSTIANNSFSQLYWLYKKSPHYEKEHLQYPVFRLME